ncbi:cactin isoform X2 [Nematostella vectensis]|uniref:cactin isoform X2 n=1 Tax=Nematostella vectensis TaxID=45351 RepID=UPI00207788D4|nr:cactin isoform X2 [Nematostella vectensis]
MANGDKKKKKHRDRSRSRSPARRKSSRSNSRSRSSRRRDDSRSPSSSPERRKKREDKHRDDFDRERSSKDNRKEKDIKKAMETAEEKRARRLAKKEAKEKKRRKEMGWNEELLGYTNTDNPFGDAHLLDSFVWHKKREKHGENHLSEAEKRLRDKRRQEETRRQLEQVRQRRTEREHEMLLREEEKERLQREKEAEYFSEWEKQEDNFHLNQAMLRSQIRIKDGRAKAIDLLAQYISPDDDNLDIKMHEPYTMLVGLTQSDLEDLLEDIKVYLEMDQGKNAEYWQDITIICKDEIKKLRKQTENYNDRRESIHTAVHSDVDKIFKGKTYSQLIALEKQIFQKISSGDAVDIGYWESLLQQLKAYMAKARLREKHQSMLKHKLLQLKQEKSEKPSSSGEISLSEDEEEQSPTPDQTTQKDASPQPGREIEPEQASTSTWRDEKDEEEEEAAESQEGEQAIKLFSEEDLMEEGYTAYEAGKYSPRLLKNSDVEEHLIVNPEEDLEKLMMLRHEVIMGGTASVDKLIEPSALVTQEENRGMGPDEEAFNVPVPITQKAYLWEDKYRPRKPRFFNRVHTGYEWNKYNQTHYDSDNPPPKIVQGYKFNIFYPDLIDKTVAPEYYLEPCSDTKDFAILRFHAGPPYEDIAFKVVNREWEYSHRHGFRCQFQNNIFQLWFHFKRYRYRR